MAPGNTAEGHLSRTRLASIRNLSQDVAVFSCKSRPSHCSLVNSQQPLIPECWAHDIVFKTLPVHLCLVRAALVTWRNDGASKADLFKAANALFSHPCCSRALSTSKRGMTAVIEEFLVLVDSGSLVCTMVVSYPNLFCSFASSHCQLLSYMRLCASRWVWTEIVVFQPEVLLCTYPEIHQQFGALRGPLCAACHTNLNAVL